MMIFVYVVGGCPRQEEEDDYERGLPTPNLRVNDLVPILLCRYVFTVIVSYIYCHYIIGIPGSIVGPGLIPILNGY